MKPSPMSPTRRRTTAPRRLSAVVAVVVAVVLLASACLSENQKTMRDLINQDRARNGRAALVDHGAAAKKAKDWARHLAERDGALQHSNLLEGFEPGSVCRVAENVGLAPMSRNAQDPDALMASALAPLQNAWMNSPSHRANVLDPNVTAVGTGVAYSAASGRVYAVQVFVRPC